MNETCFFHFVLLGENHFQKDQVDISIKNFLIGSFENLSGSQEKK